MSLAHGGVYGLLPGNLRRFGALVCPLFGLTEAALQDRIDLLVTHDFYHTYEVDGKAFIWIRNYHHFQSVRWDRVGKPEQPLPEEWIVPDELSRHVAKQVADLKDGKHPEEWGLREVHLRELACWPAVEARWWRPLPQPPQDNPGNSSQLQELPGDSTLDVDVDVDSNTDNNDRAREEKDERPRPRAEAYPPQADPSADTSYLKQNYPCTAQWLFTNCKRWSHKIRDRWLAAIVTAIESASDEWITSDQQAAELLATHPPKGSEENLPSKWLERVEKEAELQPAPPVNVFAALINRTPEEQERIDAQAQRMFDEEKAELAAAKAANGGGGA